MSYKETEKWTYLIDYLDYISHERFLIAWEWTHKCTHTHTDFPRLFGSYLEQRFHERAFKLPESYLSGVVTHLYPLDLHPIVTGVPREAT